MVLPRGIKLNRSEVKRLDLEGEKTIRVRVDLAGDRVDIMQGHVVIQLHAINSLSRPPTVPAQCRI